MNLIKKLAELVGFHESYTDAYGKQVYAKDEAQRSLLNAMGYNLDNDAAIQQHISQLSEKSWREALPVCHIAKCEEEQHNIVISLPVTNESSLSWVITTESGEEIKHNVALTALYLVAENSFDNNHYAKYQLPLPVLEQGYHQFTINVNGKSQSCPLIYAPKSCYSPEQASKNKVWGYAAQLYSLKSDTNWGLGDFGDLQNLVKKSAENGASAIGLNPLHPLYQNNPSHRSPYSPTSRCFLNSLYIDVPSVPNFKHCQAALELVASDEFIAKINFAKDAKLIDYPAVADIKYQVLELLFTDLVSSNKKTKLYKELNAEFTEFKLSQGDDLLQFSTFDALYEHFRNLDENAYGWTNWPADYQQPKSEAVEKFKKSHANRINYFSFLQWLAHRQLTDVADNAKDSGMPIGLYLDLAVGCDGSGVDVWSDQEVYVAGAAVGAPPDIMNSLGQDWGLTPINPVALQQQGYMPLVKALRSNMQYAGALRIDHILGLMRQYWVAPGMAAHEGIFITFPLADILRIIALESQREHCVVIGEDLGTVPDGFGEIMHAAGLLSYKVLFIERWESGLFKRPELYSDQSMVTVSTHDLPTLAGWWTGRDLEWRQNLDLYPNPETGPNERRDRITDRQLLISALKDLNVIDHNALPEQTPAKMNTELTLAVQKYLAQAPSYVQLIPLEDSLEIVEQVNIPGTIDEHPNWRQKLPVTLNEFWKKDSVIKLANAMQEARPR